MTIHTLHPRLNHPAAGDYGKTHYHYDDTPKEVYAEPLVASTTEAIHQILLCAQQWTDIKVAPEFVTLRFSDSILELAKAHPPDRWPVVRLNFSSTVDGFSTYNIEGLHPEHIAAEIDFIADMHGLTVDLCPHLMDYFPSPPDHFFVEISNRTGIKPVN